MSVATSQVKSPALHRSNHDTINPKPVMDWNLDSSEALMETLHALNEKNGRSSRLRSRSSVR